jgi:GNAT superfamily N-acetyltransferase
VIALSPAAIPEFRQQAREFAAVGAPGMTRLVVRLQPTERYNVSCDVDCLLYRDKHGKLRGILTHHPYAVPPFASAHDVMINVEPRYRRKGIARRLLRRALELWPIDVHNQRCTADGAAFIAAFTK